MSEFKIFGDAHFAFRSDTLENWKNQNPVLESGEPGVVTGLKETGDGLCPESERVKWGDGVTPWNDLPWWKGPQGEKGEDGVGVGGFTEEGGEIFNSYEGEDLNHALDIGAHAEGRGTIAAKNAHAQGRNTQALGNASHAEGNTTVAVGNMGAHAEGRETLANGEASHAQGAWSKAIADRAHAGGNTCFAGTKAFEITKIDFTPKTEDDTEEKVVGAMMTYHVSANGSVYNDAVSLETAVPTIAKAIEIANVAGFTAGDVVLIILYGASVDMGTMPAYAFDLVIDSYEENTKTKINLSNGNTIANNEGAKTKYKNVEIVQPVSWKTLLLSGSNTYFSKDTVFTGNYNTVAFGTGNDGGAAKTIAGQKIEFNCALPYAICLSNGAWSSKTYSEDVNLIIDNEAAKTNVMFNTYYANKASGKTIYNKNVNIALKSAFNITFSQTDGAVFGGALQIVNSTNSVLIHTMYDVLSKIAAPKWILTNRSSCKDVISFTETAGVFKVKEGYTVEAYHDYGITKASADGILDLSEQSGEWNIEVLDATKFIGTITLDSVVGLEPKDDISIKAISNQDFLLNAGIIETVNSDTNTITVEGYPSQINRFLTAGKEYLFVLGKPTIGNTLLGASSNADGTNTMAIGTSSRATGRGTIATGDYQVVFGKYNANKPNTVLEIGCGTSDTSRANAFEVYNDGAISIYGTKITRSNLRRLLELIG